ncbi:MAG: heavy-metal-associated domain-containing protein [Elusimicrobia bacterium]|nr:heavy-metal-associated domain-containing protein [Elusimicrobiota bacterium]
MKNALMIAALAVSAHCCCAASSGSAHAADAPAAQEAELSGAVTFQIKGMSCPVCVFGVKKQLKKLPGVATVSVSYKAGTGLISLKPGVRVKPEDIRRAVKKAGYEAVGIKTTTEETPSVSPMKS